ncbi:peptidase S8/S53 domain-containing protein [Phlyctochytrium arcticum]|nr:peptidase S8/S53 domain-containing protein [Phlyctochytrium arcticum]
MRVRLASLTALVAALASSSSVLAAPELSQVAGTAIPDSYIVVFKDGVQASAVNQHWNKLAQSIKAPGLTVQDATDASVSLTLDASAKAGTYGIRHQYNFGKFKGYAARIPADVAERLRNDPNVAYVEQDKVMTALGEQKNPPSWGLARIGARTLPLATSYIYPDSAGTNVDAYIIDTGIAIDHPEFQGRAKIGKSFTSENNDKDGNGHGTHVAGTIGSKSYGVAKNVSLIAIKVLDARGSGTTSDVIAGIDYVAKTAPTTGRKSVANMSLGGGASSTLDKAVQNAIAAGVVFAVAAGNSAGDACSLSPARVPEAITVAASDKNDRLASFSEKGKCVDIIAPGVDITSTWNNGNTNTISGTSMATPHVAGVVALALAEGKFNGPADVDKYLKTISTKNKITGNLGATPNNLLYNAVTGGKVPDSEPALPTPGPVDPTPDPGNPGGACPIPQCFFDQACTECCFDC